jgi:hypothetical protein
LDGATGCAHEHFHIDGCNIAVSSMEYTLLPLAQRNLGPFQGIWSAVLCAVLSQSIMQNISFELSLALNTCMVCLGSVT